MDLVRAVGFLKFNWRGLVTLYQNIMNHVETFNYGDYTVRVYLLTEEEHIFKAVFVEARIGVLPLPSITNPSFKDLCTEVKRAIKQGNSQAVKDLYTELSNKVLTRDIDGEPLLDCDKFSDVIEAFIVKITR